MSAPRILLVDDEQDLVWAVRHSLQDDGYEVMTSYDGLQALAVAHQERPDIIILDIVMPELDGLQVCHRLRRDPGLAAVPILFLTRRSAIEDRLKCFDEGSDDFLAKPFDLRELKVRVRALLNRSRLTPSASARPNDDGHLMVGALTLDAHTHEVRADQRRVQLTPAEFDLLRHLMTHPGQVFSSQQLLQQVWGYGPESAELGLVRWHIMNLRSKIENDPTHPVYLRTVPRHGYILSASQ